MLDWNKIIGSHVVKNFQKVLLKWWGIDIRFYDVSGNEVGNQRLIKNPLCSYLHTTSIGAKKCTQNYRKRLHAFNRTKDPFVYSCYAGIQGVASPIFVKGNYAGAIVGSGVQLPHNHRKAAIDGLVRLGLDRGTIEKCYQGLKQVSDHSEEYVLDLMKAIAADIMAFGELLQENEGVIQKQATMLHKTRNGKYPCLVGNSQTMEKVFGLLDSIDRIESPVLIEGESGTGKELIAAAVHYNSVRKNKVFVLQNCAAFSETLLNSELFGHEKGAFTGATHGKKGLFEIADSGTLFLDEIGDMNKEAQARLLRVLEDKTFYSVGGVQLKKVDVRVITATNKNLHAQVEQGLFRRDLYYRINVIHLKMPPLRERKEDIPLLADHFLESFAKLHKEEKKELSREVIDMFLAYHWPGNIRELKNLIERLSVLSGKSAIIEKHLIPEEIARTTLVVCSANGLAKGMYLRETLKALERDIIRDVLLKSGWNKLLAYNALGISRASLDSKIAEYALKPTV